MAFMSYDHSGIKGYVGVTGVKKVKSENALLLQITADDHVSCPSTHIIMCISFRPSTYVMRSKVNLRSFVVTGVKRCFYMIM